MWEAPSVLVCVVPHSDLLVLLLESGMGSGIRDKGGVLNRTREESLHS